MNSKLTLAQRVNILRASVMGANDGIISVAGIVVGVAGASASNYGFDGNGGICFSQYAKRLRKTSRR